MKFKNEPLTDFTLESNHLAMRNALEKVRREFGRHYPTIIDGKRLSTRTSIFSFNPSLKNQCVGRTSNSDSALANRALAAATKAFEKWKMVSIGTRAAMLRRMAARLRRQKHYFSAWLIYEVGKNWNEADADTAEAIDFLEYYAELALLPAPTLTPVPNERNEYRYIPLGPVVVLPPWNFPLAILVGMTSAAIVTGNTVILKPSSLSPVIAAKFVELTQECGLPEGVLNFLPGSGSAIGDYLVRDDRTRMVAFTGSKEIGLRINRLAAQASPSARWMKRVVAEMGGKNAIIVDESADLAEAAQAIFFSAFGYQGQKCSACSRAFVHKKIYREFLEHLQAIFKTVQQGRADDFRNVLGPVISESARKNILRAIGLGRRQGALMTSEAPLESEGFYVRPTILTGLHSSSPLWFEEIFGPVVAVAPVASFDEALSRANETNYGLTGAVYSHRQEHLRRAREQFFCGNLYFNRKSTGAWVGGHPFGGFSLSGTDSKAGGPDYLLQFTQPQTLSARISRP